MFDIILTMFITAANGSTAASDISTAKMLLPAPASVTTPEACETYRKAIDASVSTNPFTLPWGNKVVFRAVGCASK